MLEIERLNNGTMTRKEMASQLGLSEREVREYLGFSYIHVKQGMPRKTKNIDEMCAFYQQQNSLKKTGAKFSVSPETVRFYLKEKEILVRRYTRRVPKCHSD